jgi:glyoxylase-like metal-dependent hydrolase (beta-lactamase superfamily II)
MRATSLVLVAVAAGCAGSNNPKEMLPGGRVHVVKQGAAAGRANVYWFETPAGTVLVDVPLKNSDAKKLRNSIIRPYRIYITEAQPERFGSLAIMKEGDVPAYTTPAIATEIRNYGDARLQKVRKGDSDIASHVEPPTPAIEERTHDMVGEVEVELLPLGPAESEASLAVYLPKTGELITGDAVSGREHLDLTWGRSVVWQDRINELKALEPKFVYPGHGTPAGPELLDETLAYLKYFHEMVASRVKPGAPAKITQADLTAVRQQMVAKYPKHGRAELLDASIAGEYAVQLAALPPAPAAEPTATAGGAPAPAPAAGATPAATPAAAPAKTTTPAATSTPAPAPAKSEAKPTKDTETIKSTSSAADELLLGGGPSDGGKDKKKKKKK